ncbi:MAG: MlaE family ABC transporter permease [bacterium]
MIYLKSFITNTGEITIFILRVLKSFRMMFKNWRLVVNYMFEISQESILILVFASLFMGMISAYQIAYQMRDVLPMLYISTIVTQAVLIEIGPLIVGIGFSGKVSSQMSAELSSMKVTDQIDALEVMSIDPIEYLVMPRVVAAVLIIPFLTLITEFSIVFGSYLMSIAALDITSNMFIEGSKMNFQMFQVFGGLIKSVMFGFFTVVLSCYFGITAKIGAKAVGKATTLSVTVSAIAVVVLDYIFTRILFIW